MRIIGTNVYIINYAGLFTVSLAFSLLCSGVFYAVF